MNVVAQVIDHQSQGGSTFDASWHARSSDVVDGRVELTTCQHPNPSIDHVAQFAFYGAGAQRKSFIVSMPLARLATALASPRFGCVGQVAGTWPSQVSAVALTCFARPSCALSLDLECPPHNAEFSGRLDIPGGALVETVALLVDWHAGTR